MLEWQQSLEPDVQQALIQARRAVLQRGGHAVSIEDLLLSLLDCLDDLPVFLRQRGVDLDELIRTIQCEQPVVAEPVEADGLSSQLQGWLARTLEIHGDQWLSVWQLLQVLVYRCERLADKAYVAVLEQVPLVHWPVVRGGSGAEGLRGAVSLRGNQHACPSFTPSPLPAPPLVSESLLHCASHLVAVSLCGHHGPVWLQCASGSLGRSLIAELQHAASVKGESRAGACACTVISHKQLTGSEPGFSPADWLAFHGGPFSDGSPYLLVLDGVTPELLRSRVERDGLWYWTRLLNSPGLCLILRSAAHEGGHTKAVNWLEVQFGRLFQRVLVPDPTVADVQAALHYHHSALEKSLDVEICNDALDLAAIESRCDRARVAEPAVAADHRLAEALLAGAATELRREWEQGPLSLRALSARCQAARQRQLVSMARQEPLQVMESPEVLEVWLAAEEVSWLEQRPDSLPPLTAERLRAYVQMHLTKELQTAQGQVQPQ